MPDELIQQIKLLLELPEARLALYILCALLGGFILGRIRFPRRTSGHPAQSRGEAMLAALLQANFGPPDYHLMNHLTLRLEDGTTQIDHILVSRFGVFVPAADCHPVDRRLHG